MHRAPVLILGLAACTPAREGPPDDPGAVEARRGGGHGRRAAGPRGVAPWRGGPAPGTGGAVCCPRRAGSIVSAPGRQALTHASRPGFAKATR